MSRLVLFTLAAMAFFPAVSYGRVNPCHNELWIFVDCSGSMFSRSARFKRVNTVYFRGVEKNLLEISAILIDETLDRLRGGNTGVRIFPFYTSVAEFQREEGRRFYDALDANGDGQIRTSDYPGGFQGENTTNLGVVVEQMRRMLDALPTTSSFPVAILVFTDGDSDYRPQGYSSASSYFQHVLNRERNRLGNLIREKNAILRVAGLLPDLNHARCLVKGCLAPIVGDRAQFIQPADDLSRVIEDQLEAALQDLARLTLETKEIRARGNKQISGQVELRNDSCAEHLLQSLDLVLTGQDGKKHHKNSLEVSPSLPLEFRKTDRSPKQVSFRCSLDEFDEGRYRVELIAKTEDGRIIGRSEAAPMMLLAQRIEGRIEGEQDGLTFRGTIRLNAFAGKPLSVQTVSFRLQGADGQNVVVPLEGITWDDIPAYTGQGALAREYAFSARIPSQLRKKENRKIGVDVQLKCSQDLPAGPFTIRIRQKPGVAVRPSTDYLVYRQTEFEQGQARKTSVNGEEQWLIPLQVKRFGEFLETPVLLNRNELQLESQNYEMPKLDASGLKKEGGAAYVQTVIRRSHIVSTLLERRQAGNLSLQVRLRSSEVEISGQSLLEFIMPFPLKFIFPRSDTPDRSGTNSWRCFRFPDSAREELAKRDWLVLMPDGQQLLAVAREQKAKKLKGLAKKLGGSEARDRIDHLAWLDETRYITPGKSNNPRIVQGLWTNENKVPVNFRWRLRKISEPAEEISAQESQLPATGTQEVTLELSDRSGANLYAFEIIDPQTADGKVPCDVVWAPDQVLASKTLYVVSERRIDTWVLILMAFITLCLVASVSFIFLKRR